MPYRRHGPERIKHVEALLQDDELIQRAYVLKKRLHKW
jgi:hypothetical protein